MNNAIKLAIGAVAVGAVLVFSGVFNSGFTDDGIDVRNTACEEISAARLAVATELGARKAAADEAMRLAKEKIADEYYAKNIQLENEYHACISRALTADPCKEPFEEIGRLYEEIMADFEAGKGFNEAKFNEREAAKQKYNECVEQTKKPEFYKEKELKCDQDLAAGREANLATRTAAEAAAIQQRDAAIAAAESAHDQKQAILNAIEEKCNEPGETKKMRIGPLTTEGSGAAVSPNAAACTGVFPGNDPDIQRQIAQLESQLAKAKAGGQRGGLFGADHIQQALDELKQELKETPRTCKVDADCGDTTPVCCNGKEVGRAVCSSGVCSSEKTQCVDPEICAGRPAMCVAPDTGAQQQDGIYISRTIPEVGSCSQNLQVVTLEQGTPDSIRYSLGGNIPSWLHIDKPSGSLPGAMNITYSCNTVQKMGPGTYAAGGAITVYNAANELINTIPFNVSITVTPVMIDAIEYNGAYLPTSQLYVMSHSGCDEADHWHAHETVRATNGKMVNDPGPDCGFGKVSERPIVEVLSQDPKAEID